jgi:RNA polymerase sigma-32 factor
MDPDRQVELDPEVLSDPLGDDDEERDQPTDETASGSSGSPGTALVRSGGGLARADPFRRYMAEIRRYRPMTREEEAEAARAYRETGDREALFRLITSNLMLVVRIALSFRRAARNLLDLIQEGNIGLLQAIERFDPEVGVRLPTYAAWWVRAYMVKFLLDNVRLVRVGTTNARRKLLRNLRDEKKRLEGMGYEVGPKLLAEHFGVSEQDVRDVQAALHSRDVSLDAPVGPEDEREQGDMLADPGSSSVEEDVARRELQERTADAIARFRVDLGERELALLDERILSDDPVTLQQIGDRFGTTREAARQAEARLMKRLGEFLRAELGDLGQIRIGPR